MNTREVKFWYWLVRRLPKKLVYFFCMHVIAHSTTGDEVSRLSAMDAVGRYGNDNGI